MSRKVSDEDRMRKRAEMQPSDVDEDSSDSGSGAGSAEGASDDDDWGDEIGHDNETAPEQQPNGEQEESIGERLNKLAHGAGPSRRKRHRLNGGGEGKPTNAANATLDDARAGNTARHEGQGVDSGLSRPKAHSRANKNRPQEASSSRAVGRFREVVAVKRKASRDPRFEGGGGTSKLNYDIFRKAYSFLGTYQDGEIEELKMSLKKEKDRERSGRMQALLTRLQQERAERSQGDRARTAVRDAKKKEREAVAGGKKPFFLKGSEKKRLSLEQRYEGLKEEGKLSKFMEKKRKKNAAKDHRWLPSKRQDRG